MFTNQKNKKNQIIAQFNENKTSKLLESFSLNQISANEFAQSIIKNIKSEPNIEPLLLQLFQSDESPSPELICTIQDEMIKSKKYEIFIHSLFTEKSNLKTINNFLSKKTGLSLLLGQTFSDVKIAAIALTSPKVPFAITQEIVMFYKLYSTKDAFYLGSKTYPAIGNNSAKLLNEIIQSPLINNPDAVALLTPRAHHNPHDIFLKDLYKNCDLSRSVCQFAEEHVFSNKANKDKYIPIRKEYELNQSSGKILNETIKKAKTGDPFSLAKLIELSSDEEFDSFEFIADFYNFINKDQNILNFEATRNSKNNEFILITLSRLDDMFLKAIFNKFNILTSTSLKDDLMDFARQKGKQDLFLKLPKEYTQGCKFTIKELGKNIPKTDSGKKEENNSSNPAKNAIQPETNLVHTEDELNSLFSNVSNPKTWYKFSESINQNQINELKRIVFEELENEQEEIKTADLINKTKNIIFSLCLVFCGMTINEAAKHSSISEDDIQNNMKNPSLIQKARNILRNNPLFNFNTDANEEEENMEPDARYTDFLSEIRQHEGFRNRRYNCSRGFPTIGYGHRIRPNENLTFVTRTQAEQILNTDATNAWNSAATLITDNVHPDAHPVVANMVYQMGLNGVRNFRNMLAALNRRDYQRAADEMLNSTWASQTPARARELSRTIRNLGEQQ